MAGKTSQKNGEKGGRPPGRLNNVTLERQAILKAMQQRIMEAADFLLDSQIVLARGVSYLYKIEKYWKKYGRRKVLMRKEIRRRYASTSSGYFPRVASTISPPPRRISSSQQTSLTTGQLTRYGTAHLAEVCSP